MKKRSKMPKIIYILALALSGLTSDCFSEVRGQDAVHLKLQEAVQARIEHLVRTSAGDFYEKSNLPSSEVKQVIASAQLVESQGRVEISSLALKVEILSEDPPEVVRHLRQYISQVLSHEGFAVDQDTSALEGAPQLSLILDVVKPKSSIFNLIFKDRWFDYLSFSLIVLAFLSSLFFLGYLILLPTSWRRLRMDELKEVPTNHTPKLAAELPPLPTVEFAEPGLFGDLGDQQIKKFPVWVDPTGVRVSDVEGIRRAFEILPFEEAIDMLTCLEKSERNVILDQLRLNPSVKNRLMKELERHELHLGLPTPTT